MQQVLDGIMGSSDKLWGLLRDFLGIGSTAWLVSMIIIILIAPVLFYTSRLFFNRWRTH